MIIKKIFCTLLYPQLVLLLITRLALPAAASEILQSKEIMKLPEFYKNRADYKAVSMAYRGGKPLFNKTRPVLGYAWNYDTAEDAVKAAIAYCKKSNKNHTDNTEYRIVFLGETPVKKSSELSILIEEYEKKVINSLKTELKKTGERKLITRLSTILQKTGDYRLSEELLYNLATGGEHLARNALAYHWAELSKNLSQALDFVDSAILSNPEFFSYHDTRALVLFRLGRKEESLESSARAVSLKPHPIALDHYGDILWKTGNKKKALKQWEKAASASNDILFIQRVVSKIEHGMTQDIVFE